MRQLLLFFVALLSGVGVHAQSIDFDQARQSIVALNVPWHFHAGDDPAWASPYFDHAGWALLPLDHSWQDPAVFQAGGSCWYRIQIRIPASHPPLAVLIPELYSSYQVFANGTLIGGFGGMPPHAKVMRRQLDNLLLPIPEQAIGADGRLTLALRIWHWTRYKSYPGTEDTTLLLGDREQLAAQQTLVFHDAFWHSSDLALVAYASLLTALTGLALFFLRRNEPVYLWLFLYAFCGFIRIVYDLNIRLGASPYLTSLVLSRILLSVQGISGVVFVALAGGFPRKLHFWLAVLAYAVVLLWIPLLFVDSIGIATLSALPALPSFLARVLFIAILVRCVRRGSTDARLLLGPITLYLVVLAMDDVLSVLWELGNTAVVERFAWFHQLIRWPIPISSVVLANLLQQASLVAILVYRFVRSRRDEEAWKTELEAAATVQQILVPAENPAIPGFAIQAVYKPAGEVGGDFFQIVSTPAGGMLAVIGDVSGKGLPAAMTVSLLVGTFRTLAHYTHSPGEILSAMNQRMLGRSNGGFTTCLCLRVDADGAMTAANAGHLAPYLDGIELELQNGLPLGLSAEASYEQSHASLQPGAHLTLMTDGVVEAQSATGELFGFARALELASKPAEVIAHAAQSFGQEDDITVLTMTRLAVL